MKTITTFFIFKLKMLTIKNTLKYEKTLKVRGFLQHKQISSKTISGKNFLNRTIYPRNKVYGGEKNEKKHNKNKY